MAAVGTASAAGARLLIFWTYTAAFFLSCLFRTANTSLNDLLAASFALNEASVGLLSSLFFLAFAATQLPLGHLIDSVGPRRAQLVVLPLAIAGAVVCAYAADMYGLALGRVLLGVGFAISLMASLCANRSSFPVASLAGVNGAAIGIGSAGAAFAGAPLSYLATTAGWQALHLGLAAATGLVLMLVAALPRDAHRAVAKPHGEGASGLRLLVRDPLFIRLAPLAAAAQGSYLAYLGYWIYPWLRSVSGYDAVQASWGVTVASIAMVAGYLLTGVAVGRLSRRGWALEETAARGMAGFALCQLAIALAPGFAGAPLWVLYALVGALNVVAFAVLSASLPSGIQGAGVTALNLLIFVVGFAVQAGVGAGIEILASVGIARDIGQRLMLLAVGGTILALAGRWLRGYAARGAGEAPGA